VTYYTARDWSFGGLTLAPQTVGSAPDFLVADGSLGSGTSRHPDGEKGRDSEAPCGSGAADPALRGVCRNSARPHGERGA